MDLFCILYIETDVSIEDLKQRISSFFGGEISGRNISDEYIGVYLKKNETRDRHKFLTQKRFVFSEYYAEVEPTHYFQDGVSDAEAEIYLDLLVHIIIALRKSGIQVAASCEYEDLIAERTGWNWSGETPDHPSPMTG